MATSSTSPLNPQPPQQPSQSQPLHNFSLPVLKWNTTSTTTHIHRSRRSSEPQLPHHDNNHEQGSSASTRLTRTRFTSLSIHDKKELTPPSPAPPSTHPTPAVEVDHEPHKPWNLRPRRSVNNNMNSVNGGIVANSSGKLNADVANKETVVEEEGKSTRLRSGGDVRENEKRKSKKKEKNNKREQDKAPRFWISLSKEEIEEDIFVITGSKPSRRPRKRSKHEQKYLDTIFPGLWLVGTTADSYRIPDAPPKK